MNKWDVPYKKVLKFIWSKSELKGTYNGQGWGVGVGGPRGTTRIQEEEIRCWIKQINKQTKKENKVKTPTQPESPPPPPLPPPAAAKVIFYDFPSPSESKPYFSQA